MLQLVEKEDTKFNARAEYWEKYFPIYGDHTSMCRYRGSEDLTGETVLKIIGLNTRLALRMFPTMDIINRPRFRF